MDRHTPDLEILFYRYLDDDLDSSETQEFNQKLNQDQATLESLLLTSHREIQWREHLKQHSTPQSINNKPIFRLAFIAAGLFLAVATGIFFMTGKNTNLKREPLQLISLSDQARFEKHPVSKGQFFNRNTLYHLTSGQAKLLYDDGTTVQITAPCKWHYEYSDQQKEFYLETGSMTSDISKQSPKFPFVFSNPFFETKIIGTSIALSADREQASLKVIQGTVQVQHVYEMQSHFIKAGHSFKAEQNQSYYWKGDHYHSSPIGLNPLIEGHKVAEHKKGITASVKQGLSEDSVTIQTEKSDRAEPGSQAALFFKISNKPQQPQGILFRVKGHNSHKTYEVRIHSIKSHKSIVLHDDHHGWKTHHLTWKDLSGQWLASDEVIFEPKDIKLISFVFRDPLNLSIRGPRIIFKK